MNGHNIVLTRNGIKIPSILWSFYSRVSDKRKIRQSWVLMLLSKLFSGLDQIQMWASRAPEIPVQTLYRHCTNTVQTGCTTTSVVLSQDQAAGLCILQLCKFLFCTLSLPRSVSSKQSAGPVFWENLYTEQSEGWECDVILRFKFYMRLINWSTLLSDKQLKWSTLKFWDRMKELEWSVVNCKTFPRENLAIWHFYKEIDRSHQLHLPLLHYKIDTFSVNSKYNTDTSQCGAIRSLAPVLNWRPYMILTDLGKNLHHVTHPPRHASNLGKSWRSEQLEISRALPFTGSIFKDKKFLL